MNGAPVLKNLLALKPHLSKGASHENVDFGTDRRHKTSVPSVPLW